MSATQTSAASHPPAHPDAHDPSSHRPLVQSAWRAHGCPGAAVPRTTHRRPPPETWQSPVGPQSALLWQRRSHSAKSSKTVHNRSLGQSSVGWHHTVQRPPRHTPVAQSEPRKHGASSARSPAGTQTAWVCNGRQTVPSAHGSVSAGSPIGRSMRSQAARHRSPAQNQLSQSAGALHAAPPGAPWGTAQDPRPGPCVTHRRPGRQSAIVSHTGEQ